MSLIDKIKDRAKQDVKTIVLPESTDERVLDAAVEAARDGIAKIVLVGDEAEIKEAAGDRDLEVSVS